MKTELLDRVQNQGGGIPAEYLEKERLANGRWKVSLKPGFTLPSRLLHETQKAVLRAGHGEDQTVAALDFSPVVGHYHEAPLTLAIYGKGHELASDLGYMCAAHELMQWIRTCPAHNCCTLRAADGNPQPTIGLRGDVRSLFAVSPMVRVMEAAEEDAADLKALPGPGRGAYQRTTALISVDERDHYVLDVCRARGAPIHDW